VLAIACGLLMAALYFLRGVGGDIPPVASGSVPGFTPAAERPLTPDAEAAAEGAALTDAPTVDEVRERAQRSNDAQRDLSVLGRALADHAVTRSAAESIQQGEYGEAADELRDLAEQANKLSPASREELASDLDQAASQMSPGGGELSQASQEAAEGLRQGKEAAQEGVRGLGEAVEQAGNQVASQQELAQDMRRAQAAASAQEGITTRKLNRGGRVNFREKVCVVTGASSGIGRGVAGALAGRGARVCVVARREQRLDSVVAELHGEGHSRVVADVGNRDQVRALAAHVRETYGRCDVLVNNAGFSDPARFRGPDDIERVEAVMRTNFSGVVNCTGELLPLLRDAAPSSIVNIASVGGRLAFGGGVAYCASKFAVVGYSEALHAELASDGVCVSSIEPGLVPTEGFPQTRARKDPLLRYALSSVEAVTAAVVDAIEHRKAQRVVPRYYYLLFIPQVLAPPLYRWGARRFAGFRGTA
jgi:NAD(P)-dependent dehydrogenase (short-subunit alcohol dehydrogenase family)